MGVSIRGWKGISMRSGTWPLDQDYPSSASKYSPRIFLSRQLQSSFLSPRSGCSGLSTVHCCPSLSIWHRHQSISNFPDHQTPTRAMTMIWIATSIVPFPGSGMSVNASLRKPRVVMSPPRTISDFELDGTPSVEESCKRMMGAW